MRKNNILLIIITTLILSSCGGSSNFDSTKNVDEAVEHVVMEDRYITESVSNEVTFGKEDIDTQKRETKIILEGDIQNKTNTFDKTLEEVRQSVEKYNGYFENSTLANNNRKNFRSTIKVPIENYNDLYNELKNYGINHYSSNNSVNATDGYYTLSSQIDVKRVYVQKLEQLIDMAVEPEELLKLYDNYFSAISELEIMEAKLENLDHVTSHSTIYFSLDEEKVSQVVTVPKEGFFKKVAIGFNSSISITINLIQSILLTLAYVSVPSILLIIFFIIVFNIYKKNKK